MNTMELIAAVDAKGDGALDELVHETASSIAAGVNNSGTREQLDFLFSNGVSNSHIANVLGLPDE